MTKQWLVRSVRPVAVALGLLPLCALSGVTACGPGTPASQLAKPPEFNPQGQTKCGVAKSQARPLIVEWPAADRAALEAQTHRGVVVVRYEGCELEVLRQCKADGDYSYISLTPKQEGVTIRNEDDLYANIPVHAAKFEGQLQRAGQLNVNMTIVGMYEAKLAGGSTPKLQGDCKGATHVISALAVGSFEFYAGADATAGGGVSVLGAGAGAKSSAHHETLSRDGTTDSCTQAKRGDAEPPSSCGALLRLEVSPLDASLLPPEAAAAAAASAQPGPTTASRKCPEGQQLQGNECKPMQQKAGVLAPEDEAFVDTRGGFEWGNRCFMHYKAHRLDNARAACKKGLDMSPDAGVRGAILFNLALVEEADNDAPLACSYIRQSLSARDNGAVRRKYDSLGCAAGR